MIRLMLLLTLAFYIIRPGEWLFPGDIRWNLILNVLGAATLAAAAASGRLKPFADRTWAYLALFVAWMILSTAVNTQFENYELYVTDMLTILVVFYMTSAAVSDRQQARVIIIFFVALALFVCYQCQLQISQGYNTAGVEPVSRYLGYGETGERLTTPQTRWIGVFNDPNDTGMLFAALAPLAFALAFFSSRAVGIRLIWGSVFAVLVYSIYGTNSRGTFLALLAALGMFFIVKFRSVRGFVLAAIAGGALLVVGPSRMGERYFR
jgi:putative inorganic carbon (HCO3(-)) transporter